MANSDEYVEQLVYERLEELNGNELEASSSEDAALVFNESYGEEFTALKTDFPNTWNNVVESAYCEAHNC